MFGKRFRHPRGEGGSHFKDSARAIVLSECSCGANVTIRSNSDMRTIEMGLCNGNHLMVLHNSGSSNLIVAMHGHRYVVPHEVANSIVVGHAIDC